MSVSPITKIIDEIPPGESRLVIFSVKGQLFKANFGQFYTGLRLWTPAGWQAYYKTERPVPEQDIYDLAAKTAGAIVTSGQ